MARKATERAKTPVEMEQANPVGELQETTEKNESGFYCYIGPNLKGLIQTGTIYRGTREQALDAAKKAIEKQPLVKKLIVSGDALPEARLKVKVQGNVLHANYQKLAGK